MPCGPAFGDDTGYQGANGGKVLFLEVLFLHLHAQLLAQEHHELQDGEGIQPRVEQRRSHVDGSGEHAGGIVLQKALNGLEYGLAFFLAVRDDRILAGRHRVPLMKSQLEEKQFGARIVDPIVEASTFRKFHAATGKVETGGRAIQRDIEDQR